VSASACARYMPGFYNYDYAAIIPSDEQGLVIEVEFPKRHSSGKTPILFFHTLAQAAYNTHDSSVSGD